MSAKWIETTHKYDKKYANRFRYFEMQSVNGGLFYSRVTRWWYKPIEKIGEMMKRVIYAYERVSKKRYDTVAWWVRRNLTFD